MKKRVLVTGAGGLVGHAATNFFLKKGFEVVGIENNSRKKFFGKKGDITNSIEKLKQNPNFVLSSSDITDFSQLAPVFENKFGLIIHTAAQPSHDWPVTQIQNGNENGILHDFNVNAVGTLNLLEQTRRTNPDAVFIQVSTNKVYGDNPNNFNFKEESLRWEYPYNSKEYKNGIDENTPLDYLKNTTKSFFGVSKTTGDQLALEYGRNLNLKTGVFRGGCITGPNHKGVELHGFLNYIIKCAKNKIPYTVYGYKGKQVRDQLHSNDLIKAFWEFFKNPKKGEAYNIGGGYKNSLSILEVIKMLKEEFDLTLNHTISGTNRTGDHICYYSNLKKFKKDYPDWSIEKNKKQIIEEILENV